MSGSGIVSPGFWLVGSLCLSFATSMVAYNEGASANLSECLTISKKLMEETSESLKKVQEEFGVHRKSCTLEKNNILNHGNEDKIVEACIIRQSKPGASSSGENHAGNQTLCMETIHIILASNAEKVKKVFPKLLNTINGLMQALKISNKTIKAVSNEPCHSFSCRMEECRDLLVFKQLTETIDRSLNYLNSPEQNPKC